VVVNAAVDAAKAFVMAAAPKIETLFDMDEGYECLLPVERLDNGVYLTAAN